jgi:peptidoglycan/LPS O-acetylase OafA/YrhL
MIPSLDGLRAISVGFVVASHVTIAPGFSAFSFLTPLLSGLGSLGVRVFFVISGFLITRLLLRELESRGRLSLAKFYYRRTLRIFPPFYVFMLTVILLGAVGWLDLSQTRVWPALLYVSNYFTTNSWYIGHAWSLAVEEQFYLLWPAALLLLGSRKGLWVACGFVVLCPLARLGLLLFYKNAPPDIWFRFEFIADSIAIGCVLAGAREWLHGRRRYVSLLESKAFFLIPLGVLALNFFFAGTMRYRFYFYVTACYTLINLGIALCLDRAVTYPDSRTGRVLNSRPLVFVGVISYSIYLWQELFLSETSIFVFPVNLLAIAIASLASYFLVERPALRLRNRFEPLLFTRARSLRKSTERASLSGHDPNFL